MRGHVRKRGSTWTYVVDLERDNRGRRRQKWVGGFKTRREAQAALTRTIQELQSGAYVEPTRETLAQYLERWLPAISATIRSSTLESYSLLLRAHVLPRLGSLRLERLKPSHLNTLYAELLRSGRKDGHGGLSTRSVRYVHTILRKALNDAVRWGDLARNPADLANPPTGKSKQVPAWTSEQLAQFFNGIRHERSFPIYLVAGTTGMRRGELAGLRWCDVDLDTGQASVVQTVILLDNKPEFADPKTERGRRVVPIPPVTVAALRAWRVRQAQERLSCGARWQDTGLVFTHEDGSLIRPDLLSEWFDRLVERSGLPRITLHGLRHSFATEALKAGAPLWAVTDILGHSSTAVTDGFYRHAVPPALREAADRMAAHLFGDS